MLNEMKNRQITSATLSVLAPAPMPCPPALPSALGPHLSFETGFENSPYEVSWASDTQLRHWPGRGCLESEPSRSNPSELD